MELTNNSWLSLPTDCNKPSNQKAIFYAFFIPYFSSVLSSLSISHSPSISYSFLISSSSPLSQLSSNIKTPNCAKNSINPAEIIVESNRDNIKKNKQTLSNSNTSKKVCLYLSLYIFMWLCLTLAPRKLLSLKAQILTTFLTDIAKCVPIIKLKNKRK